MQLQNQTSAAIQLSKPVIFGHRGGFDGGFGDVDATWRWGPPVSPPLPSLSLLSSPSPLTLRRPPSPLCLSPPFSSLSPSRRRASSGLPPWRPFPHRTSSSWAAFLLLHRSSSSHAGLPPPGLSPAKGKARPGSAAAAAADAQCLRRSGSAEAARRSRVSLRCGSGRRLKRGAPTVARVRPCSLPLRASAGFSGPSVPRHASLLAARGGCGAPHVWAAARALDGGGGGARGTTAAGHARSRGHAAELERG